MRHFRSVSVQSTVCVEHDHQLPTHLTLNLLNWLSYSPFHVGKSQPVVAILNWVGWTFNDYFLQHKFQSMFWRYFAYRKPGLMPTVLSRDLSWEVLLSAAPLCSGLPTQANSHEKIGNSIFYPRYLTQLDLSSNFLRPFCLTQTWVQTQVQHVCIMVKCQVPPQFVCEPHGSFCCPLTDSFLWKVFNDCNVFSSTTEQL